MNAPVRPEAPRAYSYVRFSTPQQAAGASLQRQTEKAAKFAGEHGLVLDTELKMTDAGVSAYRGKNAKTGALGGFLEAVDKGYTRETPAWIVWDEEAREYKPIPERAVLVREMFKRADAGEGIDRIAKEMNQNGIDT
jgi:Resolvase, N terminal domain